MLISIATLEEDSAIVGPRAIIVLMQRASADIILARSYDDIFLSVCSEELGITKVV